MTDDIINITTRLDKAGIPYMISGSTALMFFNAMRTTYDVDVVILISERDIDKLLEVFVGFYHASKEVIAQEMRTVGMFNFIDQNTALKVDFIVRKQTEHGLTEFERRQKHAHAGAEVWVVSIEDLIIAKLKWIQQLKSGRQLEDIRTLLEKPDVDMNYLKHWIDKLRLNTFELKI